MLLLLLCIHVTATALINQGKGPVLFAKKFNLFFCESLQLNDHSFVFQSQRVTGLINGVLTLALSLNYAFCYFFFISKNSCVRLGGNALINLYANSKLLNESLLHFCLNQIRFQPFLTSLTLTLTLSGQTCPSCQEATGLLYSSSLLNI